MSNECDRQLPLPQETRAGSVVSHPVLRLLGIAAALALAYAAQYLFDHPQASLAWLPWAPPPTVTLAALSLLLGAVLFALAAPAAAPRASLNQPSPQPLSWPLSCLGLTIYAFNLGNFLANGETPLLRWLWAASLLLLALSLTRWSDLSRLPRYWRMHARSFALPALLLLLALALRLFRLTTLPQDLHGDMASHGLQARAILDGSSGGIIGAGWADIPLAAFLPTVATMALTKNTGLVGLNLASAIGGVASIWGLYVLLHEVLGRRIALTGAALLAVAYTHIHFSRIAEYMDPVPFAVWALAMLAIGLRSGRWLAFLLSGMLLAAASLMYYSGRVVVVVVLLFLLYLLIADRQRLRDRWQGIIWLGLGFVAALGPMLIYFGQRPDQWLSRSRDVFLFNPAVLTHLGLKYGVSSNSAILLEQIRRSLLTFNLYGDSSTQFGLARPMVDSLSGPLVVLGFAHAIAHPRRPAYVLLALWLACVLVMGSILTDNAPFWPRLVLLLLPAAGLAALAIDRTWQSVTNALGIEADRTIAAVVVVGLIGIGLANWLVYYPFAAHNGRPRALVGRLIASLPPDATVCLISEDMADPYSWIHSVGEREIAFFLPPRLGIDVSDERLLAPLDSSDPCGQAGAVWIVPQPREAALRWLETAFPGGQANAHGRRRGETSFFSYRIP